MTDLVYQEQMAGMRLTLLLRKDQEENWPTILDLYWKRFQGWSDERFMKAVYQHCEQSRYFPARADLIEAGKLHPVADQPVQVHELLAYKADEAADDAARIEAITEF